MKFNKRDIEKGLNDLVEVKFLLKQKNKFSLNKEYYAEILYGCKGKSREEILIEALWKAGYFKTARTEKEIMVAVQLLLL